MYEDISPRWSHDGTRIAFLRRTTDRRLRLFVSAADLSSTTPLLEPILANPDRPFRAGRADYRAPDALAWTADGRAILLEQVEWFEFPEGDRLPGTGLWSCDVQSHHAEPVGVHVRHYEGPCYYYRSPAWSASGRFFAFVGEGSHGECALVVRPLAGTRPEIAAARYDQYADADWPVWSPDGRLLAFRQGILRAMTADAIETIRVIEPGGLEARRVFAMTPLRWAEARRTEQDLAPPESPQVPPEELNGRVSPHVSGLAWSPDGRRLAFALTPNPARRERWEVWVVDLQGGSASRVSPRDGTGYLAPVWIGPRRLGALCANAPGSWDAVEIRIGQGRARKLCTLPSDDMDWSPDRRQIVCAVPPVAGVGRLVLIDTGVR